MAFHVKIVMRRSGLMLPAPEPQTIETYGSTPTSALARAVLAMLPLVGASMPGLYREMIALRRDALIRGRLPVPPSGEAS
jgi:hypothetical protein